MQQCKAEEASKECWEKFFWKREDQGPAGVPGLWQGILGGAGGLPVLFSDPSPSCWEVSPRQPLSLQQTFHFLGLV